MSSGISKPSRGRAVPRGRPASSTPRHTPRRPAAAPFPGPTTRAVLLACLLALITLVIFWPVTSCGFINYDDDLYLTANPFVFTGIRPANIAWAVTTLHSGFYVPLTWLSLQLDATLYPMLGAGAGPAGFHLTNLVLHAANAGLLLLVLRALTGSTWRSALAAALFALHPLRVESVAWVAERKDVLSVPFGLLAVWSYVRYARRPSVGRYMSMLSLYVLSLLAKPMLVTLPFLLLLLDYWPLGRAFVRRALPAAAAGASAGPGGAGRPKSSTAPGRAGLAESARDRTASAAPWAVRWLLLEKLPLLLLASVASVVTSIATRQMVVARGLHSHSLADRLQNAAVAYACYLRDMVWFKNLALFHPMPDRWPGGMVAVSVAILLLGTVAALCVFRRTPWVAVGWLWFVGTLVPVIGLMQSFDVARADRFTYFPSIGLCLTVVWSLPARWASGRGRLILASCCTAILLLLSVATWTQIGYWQDAVTVFQRSVEVSNRAGIDNPFAHYSLGRALADRGQANDAAREFEQALAIDPDQGAVHDELGMLLLQSGRAAEAGPHLRRAVALDPDSAVARNNLASFLAGQGDLPAAAEQFREAIRLAPAFPNARLNLGYVLGKSGNWPEAQAQFDSAAKLRPGDPGMLCQIGHMLMGLSRPDLALPYYQQAVSIDPRSSEAAGFLRAAQRAVTTRPSVE